MSTEDQIIDVAADFSRFPAGRYRKDGRFSGQRFREEFLVPSLNKGGTVIVILDGAAGYGPSFLEEAFGGLVRLEGFSKEDLRYRLEIQTSRTSRREMIFDQIERANPQGQ